MIITVGGIKGGCGKSLIATNFVVMRAMKGKRVLLVDADEQGTSGDWSDHRTELGVQTTWTTIRLKANAVRTEIKKMADSFDDIIIDCGGRDTASLRAALTISDIFLVPFQPKSFDIWTTEKVSLLVQEATLLNEHLKTYAVINCACSRGKDNDDAKTILAKADALKLLPMTIGLRKGFSNATAEGLGIIEMRSDTKAKEEMIALHNALFGSKKTVLQRQ